MRRGAVAVVLAALGCGPATGGDPVFWTPYEGSGAGGGGGDQGAGGSGQSAAGQAGAAGPGSSVGGSATGGSEPGGCVRVQVTTVTSDGEFAPRNVGAIWVTTAGGQFVRTLQLWGNKRSEHLVTWEASSQGNVVDAVTSATLKQHAAHDVWWDCQDATGAASPPGDYRIRVEVTESNSSDKGEPPGLTASWPFQLGAGSFDLVFPDQAGFTAQHLSHP